MARPKKRTQRNPFLGRKLEYYTWAHKEKYFPDDKALLHDIIRALLRRLSHKDVSGARRVYHAIQLLSVAEESWKNRPNNMQATSPEMNPFAETNPFERGAYFGERLCEIAEPKPSQEKPKPSKKGHWGPAFPMQREILEEWFRREAFPIRGAVDKRVCWLARHGSDLNKLLQSLPCYCGYATSVSLADFSEKDFKRSETLGGFVSRVLAKLHGITQKTAKNYAKNPEPDGIPIGSPWGLSSLPLLEIDSRINPPFPPFQIPHHPRKS